MFVVFAIGGINMAKERTLIGLELKEFLDCIREKSKPEDCCVEGTSYYIGKYCLSSEPYTLVKTGDDGWRINFTDTYGQCYSTLAPLLKICLLEADHTEKMQEISKIESSLNELLEKAAKLELLDEVSNAIRKNYSESFQEILERAQEALDSYKDLL